MVEENRTSTGTLQDTLAPYDIPVERIETPPFFSDIVEEVHAILAQHGARLEQRSTSCVIHFPPGTTKTEIWPRITQSRYKIVLPGGLELFENESVSGPLSVVRFPMDLFSEELQERYTQP